MAAKKIWMSSPPAVDRDQARHAAALIRAGKLVAFPTETVYGLGAHALNAEAVERIFAVKGRPPSSPLIVHVASPEMAREQLAASWPREAEVLAARYWPGPLAIVLPKQEQVPDRVTAGLPTVGVRIPRNAWALALLEEAAVPIAAPSANRFTELSPTTAQHVRDSLGTAIDYVLDGGPATVGIESTVISLAHGMPLLLRPGMISREEIEQWIGPVAEVQEVEGAHPSPGMHLKHYSPRTKLYLLRSEDPLPAGNGAYLYLTERKRVARLVAMPADPAAYAQRLYGTLHQLDREGLEWIAVEIPPSGAKWAGIRDRLTRAAS